MTGLDIKEKVERYMQQEPSDEIIIDGIQEAINWLGVWGYIINTITIEAEEKEEYNLPNEWIRVIKVEIPDEHKYYYNYKIEGNIIRFKDAKEYKIYLQRHPYKIEHINDDLQLHPMLEGCVLTYIKGFTKTVIDDTSQDGHMLKQQFKEDSMRAYEFLIRGQNTPAKVRVIRHA